MDFDEVVRFVQGHFTDGLVLVIGSGLSVAEGLPGMSGLAAHLCETSKALLGEELEEWTPIGTLLNSGEGLESALLRKPPSAPLERWIVQETCNLLIPAEREIMRSVITGNHTLRLTRFLDNVLKPRIGIPILTTNYDRLVELACEMAGLHVDTTAIGQYAGKFDHERSRMGSSRGIITRSKAPVIDHFPRAIVLKPHGSFDWYQANDEARRCSIELDAERLIITPGLNKYRVGYNEPFDKHRELANEFIKRSTRLLIVGYGFNDDHLQTHLNKRIREGTPTLILNLDIGDPIKELIKASISCIAFSKPNTGGGVLVNAQCGKLEVAGADLWDLGTLVEELLT